MKAIKVGGGLDTLDVVDIADPGQPGPGEIRVKLHASSLNYHDYGVVSRGMAPHMGRIPMSDGAGVVEVVGAGVSEFAVGDAVVSTFFPNWIDGRAWAGDFASTPGDGIDGFACEYAVRPTSAFTHAPKGWSHAEAATLTTAGLTAWRALVVDAGIKAGDSVLVLGTGGVSIFALQMAKAMGATVIATSSSAEKIEKLKALGADATLNYKETPEWGVPVRQLTQGRGADIVVEVGGAGTLPQSIMAVAQGGHIAMIGVLTGPAGPVPTAFLMARQATLKGLIVGSRVMQQEMIRALEATGFKPVIDSSFPLEGIADAFLHEEAGAHFGKIVLEW
jgi:NADPH:quinone reductase-like Zn-dependent oxidoreductase